jgi:hypothetical protein
MGRKLTKSGRPFRFILNHSSAKAPNTYLLLYPKPFLQRLLQDHPERARAVWQALNEITPDVLTREGRVYGGGLHKLEPKELARVPAETILNALPELSLDMDLAAKTNAQGTIQLSLLS